MANDEEGPKFIVGVACAAKESSVGDNWTVCTAPPETTAVTSDDAGPGLPAASSATTR